MTQIDISTTRDLRGKDLLLAVRDVILNEPKRLNMIEGLFPPLDELTDDERTLAAPSGEPACNTVGCVAGWCCVLTGNGGGHWDMIRNKAGRLLGELGYSLNQLFYDGHWPVEWQERLRAETAGSAAYAKIVAERIDWFIENWPENCETEEVEL